MRQKVQRRRLFLLFEIAAYNVALAMLASLLVIIAVGLTDLMTAIAIVGVNVFGFTIRKSILGKFGFTIDPLKNRGFFFTYSEEALYAPPNPEAVKARVVALNVLLALFVGEAIVFLIWYSKMLSGEIAFYVGQGWMTLVLIFLLYQHAKQDEVPDEESSEKIDDAASLSPRVRQTDNQTVSQHIEQASQELKVEFPPTVVSISSTGGKFSWGMLFDVETNVLWVNRSLVAEICSQPDDERWIALMGVACAKYLPILRGLRKVHLSLFVLAAVGAQIAKLFGWEVVLFEGNQYGCFALAMVALSAVYLVRKYLEFAVGRSVDLLANLEAGRIIGSLKSGIRLNDRWSRIIFPKGRYSPGSVREFHVPTGLFAPITGPEEIEAELRKLE